MILWKIPLTSEPPLENTTEQPLENATEHPRCFLKLEIVGTCEHALRISKVWGRDVGGI